MTKNNITIIGQSPRFWQDNMEKILLTDYSYEAHFLYSDYPQIFVDSLKKRKPLAQDIPND